MQSTIHTSAQIVSVLSRLAGTSGHGEADGFDYESYYLKNQLNRYYHALMFIADELPPGVPVLDVGNYPGHLQKCLLDMGYDVDGLDITPERIPDALALCRDRTHQANIETDQFSSQLGHRYGAVLLLEVIEHLHVNPLHLLGQINLLLPDGGKLVLSTPNLLSLRNRLNFFAGRQTFEHPLSVYEKLGRHGSRGHQRLYSIRELVDLLNVYGFEVDKVMATDYKSPCLRRDDYAGLLPADLEEGVIGQFWSHNRSRKARIRRSVERRLNARYPNLSETLYLSATRKREFNRDVLIERLSQADPWADTQKFAHVKPEGRCLT